MKSKFSLLTAILLISVGQACSDDGSPINSIDGDHCKDVSCTKGTYCYNGECRKPVKEGGKCLDGVPCASGSECIDGYCKTPKPDSKKCTSKNDCKTGKVCIDGACVLPKEDGECHSDDECAKGSRCLKNACAEYQKQGDDCDLGADDICDPDSLFCYENKCKPFLQKGEPCDEFWDICAPELSCENGICMGFAKDGEQCSELDACYEGSLCDNGICKSIVKNGGACNPTTQVCEDGSVCQGGICIKSYGRCETNSDCSADSYCCLMSGCETKNVCFPYGEGPGGSFDSECKYQLIPGQFEASVQCEWPLASDNISSGGDQIMSTMVVADLPFDSNGASEIVTNTFGSGSAIRIFNGENCKLYQTIEHSGGLDSLALADLDNDGKIEIISGASGISTWHWSDAEQKYVKFWSANHGVSAGAGAPSVHDINNDGIPEIIVGWAVYNGQTGALINTASTPISNSSIPILGDVDNDGNIELIAGALYRWDNAASSWVLYPGGYQNVYARFFAYADFGKQLANGGFDYTQKDGVAEIVVVGSSVSLMTLSGQILMNVAIGGTFAWAGPPNVGDFDGDGMPEIGVAGRNNLIVYDPLCKVGVDGCKGNGVLWESISQDESSGQTGSSTFDFDSDGRVEVIYGDECYTRIYDGKTGEVVFSSYRTSNTAYENPTIVDVDHDMSAEIIMGGDSIAPNCPVVDPNHHGVRCTDNFDCYSNKCVDGYCRCTSDRECNSQYDGNGQVWDIYSCTTPLSPQNASDGNVCRAKHPNGIKKPGFRILRDRLDRWASTRTIWNQHAYSVTNVNDDGTIPKTSDWKQNFLVSELNNYRQNSQGKIGAGYAPDITGRLDESTACIQSEDQTIHIGGTLCNRGVKDVGSRLPATFYLGDPADNNILCPSYTDSNVVSGECRRVECTVKDPVAGTITMVVNDDGKGGRTTVECDTQNNRDSITISECKIN